MKLVCKHSGAGHTVFIGHPHHSIVCGIIKVLEPGWWEWQVRHRKGAFDVKNSRYRPSVVRCGYAKKREDALRKVIDYIKSGEWDE